MAEQIWQLARMVKALQDEKYDVGMACCGMTGSSKSTFAIQLAKAVSKLNSVPFSFEANTVYDRQSLFDAVSVKLPERSVIIADEAVNILFNRKWMEKEQIKLIQLFDVCRDRKMCIIFCIPQIQKLDLDIREMHIKIWVEMWQRGLGIVFTPDRNPFSKDKWHMRLNEKRMTGWNANPEVARRSLNYQGTISFDPLTNAEEAAYLEVKHAKRLTYEQNTTQQQQSKGRVGSAQRVEFINKFWRESKGFLCESCRPTYKQFCSEKLVKVMRK